MRNGTYYLNNTGHRWITYENGKPVRMKWQTKSGAQIERSVIYFESFGNFATACISYKGKRVSVFPDTVLED